MAVFVSKLRQNVDFRYIAIVLTHVKRLASPWMHAPPHQGYRQ
jgi:hypothetical protein